MAPKNMQKKAVRLILGSASPRRKELLDSLGVKFKVIKPDVDESILRGEDSEDYALRIATLKAGWVMAQIIQEKSDVKASRFIVLSADTIVVLGKKILGKPRDANDAKKMLRALSGKTHKVITGISIILFDRKSRTKKKGEIQFSVTSCVTFKRLSAQDISTYTASKEPLDKAGAYAVQGKAAYFVKSINGSYTNVVGLPLTEVVEVLEKAFS